MKADEGSRNNRETPATLIATRDSLKLPRQKEFTCHPRRRFLNGHDYLDWCILAVRR